jgi:flagellar biosynthesis/type III secretory pathway protein FliH
MARILRGVAGRRGESRTAVEAAGPGRAECEAERILAAARAEGERLRAEALEAGRRAAEAEAEVLREAAVAEMERLVGEAEEEILRLALAVAGKVVGRAAEDGVAVATARRALARLRGSRQAEVRVHPDDAPAVRAAGPGLLAALAAGARLEVVEDPEVGRGGALVETDTGSIDARVETQLAELGRTLAERA